MTLNSGIKYQTEHDNDYEIALHSISSWKKHEI